MFLGPVWPLPLSTRGTIGFFLSREKAKNALFCGAKVVAFRAFYEYENQEFQGNKKGFEGQNEVKSCLF